MQRRAPCIRSAAVYRLNTRSATYAWVHSPTISRVHLAETISYRTLIDEVRRAAVA
jgi:hypothetical protein